MLPYTVPSTMYVDSASTVTNRIQTCSKWKTKTKKTICLFIIQKCGKFWRLSLDNFIKHKSFFSEEYEAGGDWVVVQSQGSMAQLSQIDFHLTDETESAEICKKYNFLKGSS